jgi:hypothetical protein
MYTAATILAACSTSTTDNKPHEQISVPYELSPVQHAAGLTRRNSAR